MKKRWKNIATTREIKNIRTVEQKKLIGSKIANHMLFMWQEANTRVSHDFGLISCTGFQTKRNYSMSLSICRVYSKKKILNVYIWLRVSTLVDLTSIFLDRTSMNFFFFFCHLRKYFWDFLLLSFCTRLIILTFCGDK